MTATTHLGGTLAARFAHGAYPEGWLPMVDQGLDSIVSWQRLVHTICLVLFASYLKLVNWLRLAHHLVLPTVAIWPRTSARQTGFAGQAKLLLAFRLVHHFFCNRRSRFQIVCCAIFGQLSLLHLLLGGRQKAIVSLFLAVARMQW
jgi:hypothetical protein